MSLQQGYQYQKDMNLNKLHHNNHHAEEGMFTREPQYLEFLSSVDVVTLTCDYLSSLLKF